MKCVACCFAQYLVTKLDVLSNDIVNFLFICGLSAHLTASFYIVAKPQTGTKARLGGFGMISRWAEVVVYLGMPLTTSQSQIYNQLSWSYPSHLVG